jgi:hypothetical protein
MLRWFYIAMHLLTEAGAARRDARIRFLKAQGEILRRQLGCALMSAATIGSPTGWHGRSR